MGYIAFEDSILTWINNVRGYLKVKEHRTDKNVNKAWEIGIFFRDGKEWGAEFSEHSLLKKEKFSRTIEAHQRNINVTSEFALRTIEIRAFHNL